MVVQRIRIRIFMTLYQDITSEIKTWRKLSVVRWMEHFVPEKLTMVNVTQDMERTVKSLGIRHEIFAKILERDYVHLRKN